MLRDMFIQMGFWSTWLIIPAIFELIPAVRAWFWNHFRPTKVPTGKLPGRMPRITILVPIYNSANTLENCLRSIAKSTYPNELINVICANNKSRDKSRQVFQRAQSELKELQLQWLDAEQGKARALNTAIYASTGDYVITMDSDGTLEPHALMNIVQNFVAHPEVQAQTGTILSNKFLIKQDPNHRLIHLNEYLEYAIAFLAGRTVESKDDQIFTMSGAFSAFRRAALMQSRLYNVDTVGEDADMTFQVRYYLKGRVALCPNAIFYVEPADGWNELYVQRQRWQRGEIEVVRHFMGNHLNLKEIWKNFLVRRLIVDHTVSFLKVIWLFAMLVLVPFGYSPVMLLYSVIAMYILYLFIAALNFSNVLKYLAFKPEEQAYARNHWWLIFTIPGYNFVISFFRVMGVINAMLAPAKWTTLNLNKEGHAIKQVLRRDLAKVRYHEEKED